MENQTNTSGSEIADGTASPWIKKLAQSAKDFGPWADRVKKIVKKYKSQEKVEANRRQYAMLWANIEVMKESVYSEEPVPVVTRRFKDKDPIGRQVSEMMERVLTTAQELGGDADTYELVRDDFLLAGRGVGRMRYEYTEGEAGPEGEPGMPTDEKALFDVVHWSDFRHGAARKWKAVPWVAFRSWLDKETWEARFIVENEEGERVGPAFPATSNKSDADLKSEDRNGITKDKAAVWEIWDKGTGQVYWVNEDEKDLLDQDDPPLDFREFFPCPKPAYGTVTTDNLIPTPDYIYYQDQAEEIDRLTARISNLTDALKVVGFYPSGGEDASEIEKALSPNVENRMIGVANWAAFAEKGGVSAIAWLPVTDVVAVLRECIELRRTTIEDVYQITGLSDIVRGDTNPNETLGAQQLKSQWGSIRIRRRQKEMARFARDIQELRAEIIAENFQQQSLQESSGLPVEQEMMELLRNERMRNHRIDIETDSTIVADEQAEKASRNEFLQVVGGFLQQSMPIAQEMPQLAPVLGEVLMFTVRGYRAGRQLEETIENAVEQLSQMAQQPQQEGPTTLDEIQAKGQIEMQREQGKAQVQTQIEQGKAMVQGALQKDAQEHELKKIGIELIAESQRPQGPVLS